MLATWGALITLVHHPDPAGRPRLQDDVHHAGDRRGARRGLGAHLPRASSSSGGRRTGRRCSASSPASTRARWSGCCSSSRWCPASTAYPTFSTFLIDFLVIWMVDLALGQRPDAGSVHPLALLRRKDHLMDHHSHPIDSPDAWAGADLVPGAGTGTLARLGRVVLLVGSTDPAPGGTAAGPGRDGRRQRRAGPSAGPRLRAAAVDGHRGPRRRSSRSHRTTPGSPCSCRATRPR